MSGQKGAGWKNAKSNWMDGWMDGMFSPSGPHGKKTKNIYLDLLSGAWKRTVPKHMFPEIVFCLFCLSW